MKDFFKSVQKSFRRKKKDCTPEKSRKESLAPTQVGGTGVHPLAANAKKSKTWSNRRFSPPPRTTNAVRGEEHHPGRRFTVTEDLKSAWTRGRQDVGGDMGVVDTGRSSADFNNFR